MFGELLQLAVTNLGRARARLIMTAGGVVVGTAAVILLIALTFGLQKAAEAGIGSDASITQIDVYAIWTEAGNAPKLNDAAVQALWQIEGVRLVQPVVRLQNGEMRVGKLVGGADIVGIDPRILPYMGFVAQRGSLSLDDGQAIASYAIGQNFYDTSSEDFSTVTVDVMEKSPIDLILYNWSIGTNRKVKLDFSAQLAERGGYFDYTIYMPMRQVIEWNEFITGQEYDPKTFVYDEIRVIATSRKTVKDVSTAIKELGYGAGGMGEYLNQLNGFFDTMRIMLGSVGGIALLVAAFGVANTMTMAILERTREIGIMKAIGATNELILILFLLEAGLVGFVGGVTGVAIAQGLANLTNNALTNMPQGEGGYFFLPVDPSQIGGQLLVIPTELSLFAILLATAVGTLAGLYPALRAANMPPVIALKHD